MNSSNLKPATKTVLEYVKDHAPSLSGVCDSLFWFGEPAMQEVRSAELLTDILEEEASRLSAASPAFQQVSWPHMVQVNPSSAVHTEYDAAPNNSQKPGVAEHSAIIEGAPGIARATT